MSQVQFLEILILKETSFSNSITLFYSFAQSAAAVEYTNRISVIK